MAQAKTAETERARKAKHLAKLVSDSSDQRHGTYTGYMYGCRCERCKESASKYASAKRKARMASKTFLEEAAERDKGQPSLSDLMEAAKPQAVMIHQVGIREI